MGVKGGKVFSLIQQIVDEVGVCRKGVRQDGIEDLQSHSNDLFKQGEVLQLKNK